MMVIFLAGGYIFARMKVVGPEFNKGLSKLVINFFLVGLILSSVVNKESDMTGGELFFSLGLWFVMIAISIIVGWLTPRLFRMKSGDRGMYSLMVSFMNNGFMGFPLVVAVYGADALFFAALSNIPFNLMLYTVGLVFLNSGEGGQKLSLKRVINAPIVATLIAILILVLKIPLPGFIEDTLGYMSSATVPLSMMCIGVALGGVALKDAFCHPKLYLISLMRLIVCPVLTWLILKGIVADPVMLGTIVILAATPTAVICTILGIENGRDGIESSEGVLLSTVLSTGTIPLLISVLGLH